MSLPGVHYALLQEGTTDAAAYGIGIGMWIVIVALTVVTIAGMWRTFDKAGKPGWAAIVPIYNMVVLCQVAGKSGWWVLLMFIPLVNIIIWIIVSIGVANNFGKGALFGVGLLFLGMFFYPILGFGDAQYQPRTA
jgi:uncharacterized membrane protein YhaH (DUF805 family)